MKFSAPIFRLKREAKLLSRRESIPLHAALDQVARQEGFERWSLLAAKHADSDVAGAMLDQLTPGQLVLLAGQREHGKTTLAFDLIAAAALRGRSSYWFTLVENSEDVDRRLDDAGVGAELRHFVSNDTSEHISAAHIAHRCEDAAPGSLVLIDYLQALDQQRHKPPLGDQVETLASFAEQSQTVVVALSQIDRRFDVSGAATPAVEHIRLPNPADLTRFSTSCFIHDGELRVEAMA